MNLGGNTHSWRVHVEMKSVNGVTGSRAYTMVYGMRFRPTDCGKLVYGLNSHY